ncbi:hypothetical protein [Sphingomonas sp. SCN 67-18]|nr:hypothetical protein [Sphingomonas sp. SCN 67-18]
MDINAQNLRTAGVGFNAAFTRGLGSISIYSALDSSSAVNWFALGY